MRCVEANAFLSVTFYCSPGIPAIVFSPNIWQQGLLLYLNVVPLFDLASVQTLQTSVLAFFLYVHEDNPRDLGLLPSLKASWLCKHMHTPALLPVSYVHLLVGIQVKTEMKEKIKCWKLGKMHQSC